MKYFQLLFFCIFCSDGIAQVDSSSTDTMENKYVFIPEKNLISPLEGIDTSLADFHNPYSLLNSFTTFLGNAGLASTSLLYNPQEIVGYNLGTNVFAPFYLSSNEVSFFHTKRPYTKAFYVVGPKEEQKLDLIHTQNIKKNWNIAANFIKSGGDGFYNRQKTNITNFYFSTNYIQLNRRYGVESYLLFNKVEAQENGGLLNDSLLAEEGELATVGSFETNLSQAENSLNEFSVFHKQYLNFGDKDNIKLNDSTIIESIIPNYRVYHSVEYKRDRLVYTDLIPDSIYYSDFFIYDDSLTIYDSIHINNVTNSAGFELLKNKKMTVNLFGEHNFISHEQNNLKDSTDVGYTNNAIDTLFNSVSVGGNISYDLSPNIIGSFSGKSIVTGYGKGGFNLRINTTYQNSDSTFSFSVAIRQSSRVPDYAFLQYSNSYFSWDNDFDYENTSTGSLGVISKKYYFSAEAKVSLIDNKVFYNYSARPKQLNNTITLVQASANKLFNLGSWHLNLQVKYQQSSSNVIPVPEFTGIGSFYYESYLFKKATRARLGIDVYYFTSYFGKAYMPTIRQFYLQNEVKVGNYPYLDAYFAFRVKRAKLFFKVSHLNAGFTGDDYFLVPHYPSHPLLFRLGVDWVFIN